MAHFPVETDRRSSLSGACLLVGAMFAALTEAVAGTVLSMARLDIMGDTYASSDEFVRLEVGYVAAKLVAFALTPWIAGRFTLQNALTVATASMTVACALAAVSSELNILLALRLVQGFSGGVILVSAQTLLFQVFARREQPLIQTLFAIGAVVAPATLAPFMHGWLLDTLSWRWIFTAVVPVGLAAVLLLAWTDAGQTAEARRSRFDWFGTAMFTIAAFSITYLLNRGNRWDWLRNDDIIMLTLAAAAAFLLLLIHCLRGKREDKLLDLGVFGNGGFSFGFLASFVAGFALLGSSYLIPSFSISILKMTPTAAGALLLPSTAMFVTTLFLTAALIQRLGMTPVATVPFGVMGLMCAMWMLSGSSGGSGIPDMLPAILLRGAALGFLFLSITLVTMLGLTKAHLVYGVGLFNAGRQIGGLIGIAFLQTFIENETAQNRAVLAAHIIPGRPEVIQRLAMMSRYFATHGMELGAAAKASGALLGKQVMMQASVIAFNSAFFSLTLFFLGAAPFLILSKVIIGKLIARRTASAGGLAHTR